jgi:cystathionine beta-lyase/cystathionine gamma-synthase
VSLLYYPLEQQTSQKQDHIYSRDSTHNSTRLETLLEALLGSKTVVYSSGLSALHALYILLRPKRVAITGGYHGAHAVLALHARLTGLQAVPLSAAAQEIHTGDVIHVETPVNPTGEARDLAHYAALAHARGAYLVVDSTFAPPGLQEPFTWGADVVMHSGTKYIGGHSDLLCGILATRNEAWVRQLREDRVVLGAVMGGLEAWLGVRSLRTLEVRVVRQSASAQKLVTWLATQLETSSSSSSSSSSGAKDEKEEEEREKPNPAIAKVVKSVLHASQQPEARQADSWLRRQMPHGYGPVFALVMQSADLARTLPSRLRLFQHATSLGGVESLVEWRAMTDDSVDAGLVRVSVGLEDWRDLKADLEHAFVQLASGLLA